MAARAAVPSGNRGSQGVAEPLAAANGTEGGEDDDRRRRRKRRRRRSSSSTGSSSSDRLRQLGKESKVRQLATKRPGELLRTGLVAMQRFIGNGGAPLSEAETGELSEIRRLVTTYLTTALQPSSGSAITLPRERELRTLAEALDLLLQGDLSKVGDVLMQRFRAVELAAQDGRWDLAQHLELIPQAGVSSVPMQMREDLLRQQALHQRVAAPARGGRDQQRLRTE